MKYRVVSILKDNRPRFLIISDIEEIEILPSKYLKHLDQINASPNTVKSAAFALSYYYNYLQEQTIGLDEITLLSYSEQNKHFIDFLYWVKSGKHTEHNTQTSNKTCNMYLGAVFRYYQFLALEDVLPMLKVLRVKKVSYFDSMGVNHQNAVNSFKGFFKEEEPNLEEITSEEIQELINACTNDRDRLLIAMMAETGLRLGDDDDKIRLNQRKPSKYKGLSRFGPEKNLQRINKFMKERPTFYKKLIQMKENFRFYLRCFYCITKVVILQFNSEKQDRISS